VRWDNIAMVGAGIAVVLGVATTLLSWSSSSTPQQGATRSTGAPALTATATDPAAANGASTDASTAASDGDATGFVTDPAEAQTLIDEAHDFIAQGRWDEAADRLDTIAPQLRTSSGVDDVRADLNAARTKWTSLDTALRSDVAALDWPAAKRDLAQLAAIAPLDDEQLALRDQVSAATAPRDQAPAGTAKTAAASIASASKAKTTVAAAAASRPAAAAAAKAAATPASGISPSDQKQIDTLVKVLGNVSNMAADD
jgi:hypothetical protein